MSLPFTETQFLDVFAAYNSTWWPVVVSLWIVTLAFAVQLARHRAGASALAGLAAFHWAWSGVAYHALFFTSINPAAVLFAALFVAEAAAIVWFGIVRRQLNFAWRRTPRLVAAGVFIAYSLAYPALVVLSGHEFPRAPAFAVPCPTTLFTAGLLLAAVPPVPRWLFVVPAIWSVVGGSAAWAFGMTPDLMLFVAGVFMVAGVVAPALFSYNQWGATDVDLARIMPGDDLVQNPTYKTTLAVTIAARPEHIWPWLVQMGYRRGGLYSYDWLDRLFGYLDRPSADTVLPEFQRLQVGDVIPVGRGSGFPVAAIEPTRALVLGGEDKGFHWTWQFGLYPTTDGRTRLVSRNRAQVPATAGWAVFMGVLGVAAFIMTRRMLLGVKGRAEALAGKERGPSAWAA